LIQYTQQVNNGLFNHIQGYNWFSSMMPMYYSKAQIAIVVFSMLERQSFIDM
jgi:GTPase SAR1 family protein